MEKEHNEPVSVDKTADDFFEKLDATGGEEKPQESSPETDQPEDSPEDGSGPLKTPSKETPEDFKGVPEGFRNHPAWMSREQKLKEAERERDELKRSSESYQKLLDDPLVYQKYLESQGLSKEEVRQEMLSKGFVERKAEAPPSASPHDIAVDICKELGWDVSRLDEKQKAYINDQIQLIQKVAEKMFGKVLDSRLGPMEGYLKEVETQKVISKDYDKAKSEAKAEFPDLDWDKDIEPAMARYLDELDKKDPKNAVKIDAFTLYEKATRQLLKEKKVSEGRQEERDLLKKNARPLLPRTPAGRVQSEKGKTVRETADAFLDKIGMRD